LKELIEKNKTEEGQRVGEKAKEHMCFREREGSMGLDTPQR
jgi:hypothetical protein